mgnify:FL=1
MNSKLPSLLLTPCFLNSIYVSTCFHGKAKENTDLFLVRTNRRFS